MRLKAVLKLVSFVVVAMGFAMGLATIVSFIYDESPMPLLLGAVTSLLFGFVTILITRKERFLNMGIAEGCAIATLSWLMVCMFGAIPFYTMDWFGSPVDISWTKSFYEAVSGFTTTGASIFSDVEILPKSILFWRSLTHWFGGMGIVVFAIAILPKLGIGGMQAFKMESSGPLKSEKLVPKISDTGRILYKVYLAITILLLIALKLVGVSWFDALNHTFSTVGTGGFSTYNNSVSGLNNIYAEYIIAVFMWLCGVNFGLIFFVAVKKDFKQILKDSEFKVYTAITLIAIIAITVGLLAVKYNNLSIAEAFRYAFFQVPSILTTTGFATYDYNLWPAFPLSVLVVLLFMGGSTGSTSGGMKVLRFIIIFKFIKHQIVKVIKPNIVTTVKVSGKTINESIVSSVFAMMMIYLLIFAGCAFALTFFGLDLLTAATASIANLGNIGPGLNSIGPVGNYSALHPVAHWILSFEMLLGRLEIYTILALFTTWAWKKSERA